MLTEEMGLENLKELKELRDTYSSTIFAEFALNLLSQKSDFSVKNFCVGLKEAESVVDFLKLNYDQVSKNKTTEKRTSAERLRCPYANKWISNSCCCMQSVTSRSPSKDVCEQILGFQGTQSRSLKHLLLNTGPKSIAEYLNDLQKRVKNKTTKKGASTLDDTAQRTNIFRNYVRKIIRGLKKDAEKNGNEFKIKTFFETRGGITYNTCHSWMGNDKSYDIHKTRPDLTSIIGFLVVTNALLREDANAFIYRSGYQLSTQFDFDLTVIYFMDVWGNDEELQRRIPLTVELFNKALAYIGLPDSDNTRLTKPKL